MSENILLSIGVTSAERTLLRQRVLPVRNCSKNVLGNVALSQKQLPVMALARL